MKIRRTIGFIGALSLLAFTYPATAQTELSCDDITFNYEMTSRFPDIGEHCVSVVEVDGERFAKFSVEVTRAYNNGASFRFMDPDDGRYGPTQRVDLDPEWRAEMGGREYRARELTPGQKLNVYLPSDRWEAHVARNTTGYFAVYYPVAMTDDADEGAAMLPSTAGLMPLLGMFGGAALFSAFLIRIFRRRSS